MYRYQGKLASSSLQVFFRTRPIPLALGLDGATATVAFGCLCLHSYTYHLQYLGTCILEKSLKLPHVILQAAQGSNTSATMKATLGVHTDTICHNTSCRALLWADPLLSNRNRRQNWLGSAGIGSWGGDLMGLEPNSNGRAIDLRDMPPSHQRLPSTSAILTLFSSFLDFCGWPNGLTPRLSLLLLRFALSRIHGNLNLNRL